MGAQGRFYPVRLRHSTLFLYFGVLLHASKVRVTEFDLAKLMLSEQRERGEVREKYTETQFYSSLGELVVSSRRTSRPHS